MTQDAFGDEKTNKSMRHIMTHALFRDKRNNKSVRKMMTNLSHIFAERSYQSMRVHAVGLLVAVSAKSMRQIMTHASFGCCPPSDSADHSDEQSKTSIRYIMTHALLRNERSNKSVRKMMTNLSHTLAERTYPSMRLLVVGSLVAV